MRFRDPQVELAKWLAASAEPSRIYLPGPDPIVLEISPEALARAERMKGGPLWTDEVD